MRIGLFTDAYLPTISGVTISVNTLKNELEKKGHEVLVITMEHDNAVEEENIIRFKGKKFPAKGLEEYKILKVTNKKAQRIKDLNLDVIHCHTEFSIGRLGRKAAKKYNIPVVHTYHTMYEDYCHHVTKTFAYPLSIMSKSYSKSFAKSADAVIFPTIKVQKTFKRYGFDKEAHIIPTGIYLDRFRKINYSDSELERLKETLGIKKDEFVLLFLGRMSREKSVTDLIEEFQKLSKKEPNVKLLLVGGGPDYKYFVDKVQKLNLQDRIVFTGMIPPNEVGYYYHIADLFVNFSMTETQGLTYIEALACGLPLLVKYDDNLEGVIKEMVNGVSFTENNDFIRAYESLTSNNIKFTEITKNATKAIDQFSAKTYADRVEKIYMNL